MDVGFTLVCDGSSDRALIPVVRWTLRQHCSSEVAINGDWADLRRLQRKPRDLAAKIKYSLDLYPCDVLFIHRDAEGPQPEPRFVEIQATLASLDLPDQLSQVPIVPVQMTEAWLLFDELAIRRAAGNPNGRDALDLPKTRDVETLADPKKFIFETLRKASGKKGRRRRELRVQRARTQIADFIDDFARLRELLSFRHFERAVEQLCAKRGWG